MNIVGTGPTEAKIWEFCLKCQEDQCEHRFLLFGTSAMAQGRPDAIPSGGDCSLRNICTELP